MKLICGLGNPGREYEHHRHNVGFMVIEELCLRFRTSLSHEKFDGFWGTATIGSEKVLLLEPQTFMNLSGHCLVAMARFYKIEPSDVLVVHDELDLPFGRLQFKEGGGTGGHNGLRSIQESWGTPQFQRLRVGIDKPSGPHAKSMVADYVLSNFRGEEAKSLPQMLSLCADACETWVNFGLGVAMNRFNRR